MLFVWTQRCSSIRFLRQSRLLQTASSSSSLSIASTRRSLVAATAAFSTTAWCYPLTTPRHRGHRRKQQQQQQQQQETTMRPLPLMLSVAAALTLRPRSTLSEARLDTATAASLSGNTHEDGVKDRYQQQQKRASSSSSKKYTAKKPPDDCPAYGCPLLPLDVHYNTEPIKNALQELRQAKRTEPAAAALLQSSGNDQAVTLTLIGYKGGSLYEQINQDRAIIVMPFIIPTANVHDNNESSSDAESILLGVFDGHAPRGELVSEFTARQLPERVSQKLSQAIENQQPSSSSTLSISNIPVNTVKQILNDTFVELDRDAPAQGSGGCTASIILMLDQKIFVANAGDSRSFIVTYRPSTKQSRVVYMSREDKPDLADERARVEAAGGQVYIPARGTSRVVYHDPRTGSPSGLAMSRSIGDWAAGKLGVIPDPIVDVIDIPMLVRDELNNRTALADDGEDATTSSFLFLDEQGDVVAGDSFGRSNGDDSNVSGLDDVYVFGVSATDGMLDYLDHNDIAKVLAKALFEQDGAHPLTAAEHLVFAAANGWQQDKQGRYRDDIAIAVATLRRPSDEKSSSSYHDPSEL